VPKPPVSIVSRLVRTVTALPTQQLRVQYLRIRLCELPIEEAVRLLEEVCVLAQASSHAARAMLVALSGLIHDPESEGLVLALRLAIEDHAASPLHQWLCAEKASDQRAPDDDEEPKVPDYGAGRPLTLGERKALARRPNRKHHDKLLLDPHPSVIRMVLTNPLTTEDDVVRLAARRPLRPDSVQEIVRHPRWNVRRRVRLALVLNPYTPASVGLPMVALLLRSELRMVVDGPDTGQRVRQAARERLRQMKGRTVADH
jgi:hypothetical protein